MRPIAWSKFAIYDIDDADLDGAAARPFPFIPDSLYKAVNCGIKEPACQVNFEDFFAGPDIVWVMPHDEVHVVTMGEADITVHLPPLMRETASAIARTGSVYFLPRAARIVWRVRGSLACRDFDLGRLALGATRGLVDHDLGIGQRKPLALGAGPTTGTRPCWPRSRCTAWRRPA